MVTEKLCRGCSRTLPAACFYPRPSRPCGLMARCKDCLAAAYKSWAIRSREHLRAYYSKNKESFRRNNKRAKDRSRDRVNAARRNRTDEERISGRKANQAWRIKNKAYDAARRAVRLARQRQAVPAWSNQEEINLVYAEARAVSDLTGVQHHVDHIVPITSPFVCGLHVGQNLDIVPWIENLRKRNLWWPGKDGVDHRG